eukprot:CAMPEP_0184032842 /NCGR_PEP_ID=MMETSP0955-20130417/3334_1 /TAXON_ID=627963 /ORGANISM="Aplanochytrium sp, Strain PBS07" /LENGTH=155 /DNA_ID=CAMNT_0026319035 /DNA_START=497 /DNA_END=964 /DNA_ORIENTATION=-
MDDSHAELDFVLARGVPKCQGLDRSICSQRYANIEMANVDMLPLNNDLVLVYPYMRHCDITARVLEDIRIIFQGGKRFILRMLLKTHRILHRSDTFYLLNRLYVTDMCVWIQKLDDVVITAFAAEVEQAVQSFSIGEDIRWDLGTIIQQSLAEAD